jgi:hypothetical protein
MNRIQRALPVFLVAASFVAGSVAHAAVEPDPASAVRGSLGVSLDNLSLSNNFGELALLLNGGCALAFGAVALFAVSRRHRKPVRGHLGDWNSGNSATPIR